jgi:hypothetical protein
MDPRNQGVHADFPSEKFRAVGQCTHHLDIPRLDPDIPTGRPLPPLDAVARQIFAAGGGGCDTPCGCGDRGELFVPRLRGARR